ncbi:MAG TPA: adenylyl-sulfate kinase [bacterium]|nr:adenylyl-sulfate kinase [bacterium]
MTDSPRNIVRHEGTISRRDREQLLGQRGCVVWFTGLSGSGKSTVSRAVEERLHQAGRLVYVLDGDNVRHGLCSDLGFSDRDRSENIRRIGHVAALLADAGAIVLTAFISPFRRDRAQARDVVGGDDFLEVFVDAPLSTCEARDPKGLYKKARAGEIPEFTGISSPYEPPEHPALTVQTGDLSLPECAAAVASMLEQKGYLSPPDRQS